MKISKRKIVFGIFVFLFVCTNLFAPTGDQVDKGKIESDIAGAAIIWNEEVRAILGEPRISGYEEAMADSFVERLADMILSERYSSQQTDYLIRSIIIERDGFMVNANFLFSETIEFMDQKLPGDQIPLKSIILKVQEKCISFLVEICEENISVETWDAILRRYILLDPQVREVDLALEPCEQSFKAYLDALFIATGHKHAEDWNNLRTSIEDNFYRLERARRSDEHNPLNLFQQAVEMGIKSVTEPVIKIIQDRISQTILLSIEEFKSNPQALADLFMGNLYLAKDELVLTDPQFQFVLMRLLDPTDADYKPREMVYQGVQELVFSKMHLQDLYAFRNIAFLRCATRLLRGDYGIPSQKAWETAFYLYYELTSIQRSTLEEGELTPVREEIERGRERLASIFSEHLKNKDIKTVQNGMKGAIRKAGAVDILVDLGDLLRDRGFDVMPPGMARRSCAVSERAVARVIEDPSTAIRFENGVGRDRGSANLAIAGRRAPSRAEIGEVEKGPKKISLAYWRDLALRIWKTKLKGIKTRTKGH